MLPSKVPVIPAPPKRMCSIKLSMETFLILWTILCGRTFVSSSSIERHQNDIGVKNWTLSYLSNASHTKIPSTNETSTFSTKESYGINFHNVKKIAPNDAMLDKPSPEIRNLSGKNSVKSETLKTDGNFDLSKLTDVLKRHLNSDIFTEKADETDSLSESMMALLDKKYLRKTGIKSNSSITVDDYEKLKASIFFSSAKLLQTVLYAIKNASRTTVMPPEACSGTSCKKLNSKTHDDDIFLQPHPIEKDSEVENKSLRFIISEENDGSPSSGKILDKMPRQFIFHPYLPHEKDIPPDEKISFHDILPVKMVKFVKQMVEEAPWEQMFMKMVRMIVDQFVDKIIEKLFSNKDEEEHNLRRSMDFVLTPTWVLPTFSTHVLRLRRSMGQDYKLQPDKVFVGSLSPQSTVNEIVGEKRILEEGSWLDYFLDYVFPESKPNVHDGKSEERLEKRELPSVINRNQLFRNIISFFVKSFETSSLSQSLNDPDASQDSLRYKILKDFLPALFEAKEAASRFGSQTESEMHNSVFEPKLQKFPIKDLKRNLLTEPGNIISARHKRSTSRNYHHRDEDEKRLWQASRRVKPPNQGRRVDCSLRQACNAGRLLSRLPSMQEITLQLRSHHNEPHWDALLWGMKKKRCSKIYCKRHRSPKGSNYRWDIPDEGLSRRHDHVEMTPYKDDESSETTTVSGSLDS